MNDIYNYLCMKFIQVSEYNGTMHLCLTVLMYIFSIMRISYLEISLNSMKNFYLNRALVLKR